MQKLKAQLKKYITIRKLILGIIFLIFSLLYFKYVAGLILVAIFTPITIMSVKYSKMVPHISIESNTGMAVFMGYCFGPVVGLIYGIVVGGVAYTVNSFISLTYRSTVLLAGVAGGIAGLLHLFGISFTHAFIAAIIIRTAIAWPWFTMIGISPFESFTHQTSQMFFNLIIYLSILSFLYGIVAPFV
ncbi:MAG: hypothetical protein HGA85_08505 [Nanoarchaeota archaeon]|nr:hypothetical protein [Nanoarchaeota archaeon]